MKYTRTGLLSPLSILHVALEPFSSGLRHVCISLLVSGAVRRLVLERGLCSELEFQPVMLIHPMLWSVLTLHTALL